MASIPARSKIMRPSSPTFISPRSPLSTSTRASSAIGSSPSVESQILTRFNESFREHQQALQQVIAVQEKQHNANQEHQFAMLTEIRACTKTVQAGTQVQQSINTEQPASLQHLREHEKRIKDHIHECFQRHENTLSKLTSSVDILIEQQKMVTSFAGLPASTSLVAGANEADLEICTGRHNDEGKFASSNFEESAAPNDASQEVSQDASKDMCENSMQLGVVAPTPLLEGDSSELTTPLLRGDSFGEKKSPLMIAGSDMDLVTKATIHEMLEEAEEEDECVDTFWAKLAHHLYYHELTIGIVIFNLIWLGVETDVNDADILCDAPLYVQVIDNLFCMFFFVDIAIRTLAKEIHGFHYWFDLLLLIQMVWETWIQVAIYLWIGTGSAVSSSPVIKVLRVFRLMRVMRALRMQKALSVAPQLMVLVKGIFAAMQSVLAILFLMMICVYFFAVVFTMLAKTQDLGGSFNNVPQSMQFFLVQIISGVDGDFISQMLEAGLAYYILFLVFVFIGTMTLMNMLIGVVCDVMAAVSSDEKEKMDVAAVEKVVAGMVRILDTGGACGAGSGSLDLDEFERLLEHPEIVKELAGLQVDVVAFVDFVRFATPEDGEITLDDLTTLVLQCRGNQTCTVKDIMEIRKFVAMQTKLLKDGEISKLHANIDTLQATIKETHLPLREIHNTVHRMRHL